MNAKVDKLISAARAIEAKQLLLNSHRQAIAQLTEKAKVEDFDDHDRSLLAGINLDMSEGFDAEIKELISALNNLPAK